MAAPIPLDAPVTTATLPDNLFFVLIVCDSFRTLVPLRQDLLALRKIAQYHVLCATMPFGIVDDITELRHLRYFLTVAEALSFSKLPFRFG
jgi:hypothetical protein